MDTDTDTRAGRVNPAEKEKAMKINMKEELRKVVIKEFLFPDDEYCDAFFGGETPCCVDEDEVRRLADEWDMPFDEVISQMHTASADEIREYGV